MTDVLLVNAPARKGVTKSYNEPIVENLGPLYVGAFLKRAGYTCRIIDALQEEWNPEMTALRIMENIPSQFIGFSLGYWNLHPTIAVVRKLREKGVQTHITMGGIYASLKHENILEKLREVDSVVVGEGEETAVQLAQALYKKKDWTRIQGIASRDNRGNFALVPRRSLDDIDSLPIPDRSCYLNEIRKESLFHILFSRGCYGRCRYCSVSNYIKLCGGRKWRSRDPIRVVDEIEKVLKETKVKRFFFVDDNFIGTSKRDRQNYFILAKEITRRGLDIEFGIHAEARSMDYELLKALIDVGLYHVNIGVESWVDSQLRRYGKFSTRKDNLQAVETANKLDLSFFAYMIPLDPYVTRREIALNLNEIEKIGLDPILNIDFCKRMVLHEYCHFFEQCRKDKLIKGYNPLSLTNDNIPYDQKDKDVVEIVKASKEMNRFYHKIMHKLALTGVEKSLPGIWNAFSEDIRNILRRKLFQDFKAFVEGGDRNQDGKEFVFSEIEGVYRNISKVCSEVTRDKLETYNAFTVTINGEEISTRLKETYEIPVNFSSDSA